MTRTQGGSKAVAEDICATARANAVDKTDWPHEGGAGKRDMMTLLESRGQDPCVEFHSVVIYEAENQCTQGRLGSNTSSALEMSCSKEDGDTNSDSVTVHATLHALGSSRDRTTTSATSARETALEVVGAPP